MKVVLSAKLQRFAALRPGEEAINWSVYHYKNLAAGALSATYKFFNVAGGAQDGDTSTTVTDEDSNMEVASMLGAPNRMLVTRICVPIIPISTETTPIGSADNGTTESLADDIARLTNRGVFKLTLLAKDYLKIYPLGQLPAGFGVWAALSAATTNTTLNITNASANNGLPQNDQGYKVMLPIESQAKFEASISFPKSTITTIANLRFGVVLHGVLYRPEQ